MHFFKLYSLSGDGRPDCFPITINSDDPYFNDSCMEFVRSAPAPSGYGGQAGMFVVYIRFSLFSKCIRFHELIVVMISLASLHCKAMKLRGP